MGLILVYNESLQFIKAMIKANYPFKQMRIQLLGLQLVSFYYWNFADLKNIGLLHILENSEWATQPSPTR